MRHRLEALPGLVVCLSIMHAVTGPYAASSDLLQYPVWQEEVSVEAAARGKKRIYSAQVGMVTCMCLPEHLLLLLEQKFDAREKVV